MVLYQCSPVVKGRFISQERLFAGGMCLWLLGLALCVGRSNAATRDEVNPAAKSKALGFVVSCCRNSR